MKPTRTCHAPVARILRRFGRLLLPALLGLGAFLPCRSLRAQGAPLAPLSPGNPFADVPADHPAYGSLRRLKQRGLLEDISPTGDPFQGRKVLTRYEFAVLLARLLEQVEQARSESQDLSEEERIIRDLTREFRTELGILGVRVDAFQSRLQLQERRVDALERRRSNIRIEGFYRATQHYVDDPVNLDNYRFDFDERPFPNLTERGLTHLEQEVFLRLIGRASPGNQLGPGIEAYAEIKARLSGPLDNTLRYEYNRPDNAPTVGDSGEDSFATSIVDEKRVSFHRGHLIAQAPFLDVRIFANEAATEPGDPSRLFSIDPGRGIGSDPMVRTIEPFEAFSGAEAGQELGKWSYFGSILQQQRETVTTGAGSRTDLISEYLDAGDRDDELSTRYDISRTFVPSYTEQTDNYALRLTYEPYKYEEGSGKELLWGLTYNEVAFDYEEEHDRNAVTQLDMQYARLRAQDELEYTVAALFSTGRGDIHDTAYRMDARYRRGGLLATMKGYYYGYGFQALNAQEPFVDTDIHHNFLRTRAFVPGPDTIGERLLRTQVRYSFDPESLPTLDDLTLEALYEIKAFDRNPLAPRENDHELGSRFLVQAIADIDSRIHVELASEIQKDIPQEDGTGGIEDEEGALTNTFRVDYRPIRKVGLSGELAFIDDFDARDEDGTHFQFQRKRTEINIQPSPAIFLKGTFEGIENSDLALTGEPRTYQNGRDLNRFLGEVGIVVANNFGIKGLFVEQKTDNAGQTGFGTVTGGPPPGEGESNLSRIFSGEANWQLSRALQLRYGYAWQDTDLLLSEEEGAGEVLSDFMNLNHFVQLTYQPTEVTEIRATYGDEYENPRDLLDNGPASFHRTAKIYRLQAQTNF